MATSVVTATLIKSGQNVSDKRAVDCGTITIAAGDYPAGGFPVNMSAAILKTAPWVDRIEVYSDTTGYTYKMAVPASLATALLTVWQQDGTTGPLKVLPTAATPAGVVADTGIKYRATRRKP